eukprot:TRINITY_DN3455_c0_g2_i5.p1 TRINITY_DN3455_c0_g2~~TRINITY_DN3455_c0_g2_i5.p1  ORF type:complete len:508 (-),score=108.31 TRINITY_DN3455_c0_g2_i5:82-1605(-)
MNILLLVVTLLVSAVTFACVAYVKRLPFIRGLDALPGPPQADISGHGKLISDAPYPEWVFMKWGREYGPVYRLWFLKPFLGAVVINDPELVRHVVAVKNYPKSPTYGFLKPFVGNGLVTAHGEEWQRHRNMLNPAFHRTNLKNMVPTIVSVTQTLSSRLDKLAEDPNGFVNIHDEFICLTIDIIGLVGFAHNFNALNDKESGLMRDMTSVLNEVALRSIQPIREYLNIPARMKFNKNLGNLRGTLMSIIQERKVQIAQGASPGNDILSIMLTTTDDQGQHMSDVQMLDEICTFFFAGHDTTSSLVAWAVFLLTQHRDVEKKVLHEINTVMGDREIPTFEDAQQLSYTLQVLRETLRMFPPAATARYVTEDDIIGGQKVQKGTIAIISVLSLHYDPKVWKDPTEFNPDRFASYSSSNTEPSDSNNNSASSSSNDNAGGRHPYSFIPFLAGPRNCIGMNFSLLEARIILIMLLRKFSFKMAPAFYPSFGFEVTMKPVGSGVVVGVDKRV